MRSSTFFVAATLRLALAIASWISTAQRTASTELANSASIPSPVVLTIRPRCSAILGSIKFARCFFSWATVPSSSSPINRLYPATSAARMAASLLSNRSLGTSSPDLAQLYPESTYEIRSLYRAVQAYSPTGSSSGTVVSLWVGGTYPMACLAKHRYVEVSSVTTDFGTALRSRRHQVALQPSLPTCPSSRAQHLAPSFSFQTAYTGAMRARNSSWSTSLNTMPRSVSVLRRPPLNTP